ncbi:hypothetical protein FRC17_000131 [Serendipita sp. 399]|nr:hypothetical protein FRC17_000131 [Serendipita sp. 399]
MSNRYIIPYGLAESAIDQALEDRRCDLLSRISKADYDDKLTSNDFVSKLREAYNETINEQWRRRRGAFADPLVALPEDIWQMIMSDVITDGEPYDSLLDLLNVSQVWMIRLMSYPTLWRMITIDCYEEDLLAKMALFLQLSQRSSIILQLADNNPWFIPQGVYDLLAQHRERINAIVVHPSIHSSAQKVRPLIDQLGGLLYLERIGAVISIEELSKIHSSTPALREVDRIVLSSSGTATDIGPLSHMGMALSISIPRLQSLNYQVNRLSFKKLRYLDLSGPSSICQDFINRLDSPLTSISAINWPLMDIETFMRSLGRFTTLQSLRSVIVLEEVISEQSAQSTDPLPILSVKSFHIELLYPFEKLTASGRGFSEIGKDRIGADMRMVSRIVGNSMIHIESLVLRGCTITEDIASMLQSLLRLRRLAISVRKHPHDEISPIHLAKLENLEWEYSLRHTYKQHPLRTDSLISYEFSLTGHNSLIPEVLFLPRECSHTLVRLRIRSSQPICFSLLDLPELRELEFGPGTSSWWASDIIEQLIVLPSTCPHLWKIALNSMYRDWDILLLALGRRNFLKDRTVSPLREIYVNRPVPFKLLYMIVQLLGGKFASYAIEEFAADRFHHNSPISNRYIFSVFMPP